MCLRVSVVSPPAIRLRRHIFIKELKGVACFHSGGKKTHCLENPPLLLRFGSASFLSHCVAANEAKETRHRYISSTSKLVCVQCLIFSTCAFAQRGDGGENEIVTVCMSD